jgi:hypothetical protein
LDIPQMPNWVPRFPWSMGPIPYHYWFSAIRAIFYFLFFSDFRVSKLTSLPLCFNRIWPHWSTFNASVASTLSLLFSWTWLAPLGENMGHVDLDLFLIFRITLIHKTTADVFAFGLPCFLQRNCFRSWVVT